MKTRMRLQDGEIVEKSYQSISRCGSTLVICFFAKTDFCPRHYSITHLPTSTCLHRSKTRLEAEKWARCFYRRLDSREKSALRSQTDIGLIQRAFRQETKNFCRSKMET